MTIKCSKCYSENKVKNGSVKGERRWKCKNCGCSFTRDRRRGIPVMQILEVINWHNLGFSNRWISKNKVAASEMTIGRWLKDLNKYLVSKYINGKNFETAGHVNYTNILQHMEKRRVESNRQIGWLLVEIKDDYWPSNKVVYIVENNSSSTEKKDKYVAKSLQMLYSMLPNDKK